MSTRKTTASAAAKVENATATATAVKATTPTTEKAAIGVEKPEMGAKASTAGENSCNETEIATTTTTNKDALKMDTKPIANEPKRITRNSPLFLLASPPNTSVAAAGLRKEQQQRGERADSEPTNSESEDGGSVSGGKRSTQIRGRKSLKEAKEAKEAKEEPKEIAKKDKDDEAVPTVQKEIKVVKEIKETKETKDTKDIKEKDAKEVKEVSVLSPASSTASTTSGTIATTTTTTNRLTRKSVAQELVTNTRITRNRQTSTGRPETPPTAPTRGRRGVGAKKMPLPMAEPASKRKRSVEESAAGNAEPGAKYIKIEVKDDSEAAEDELMHTASAGSDLEGLRIKHELIESDESAAETVGSTAVAAASTTTTTSTAGRGRGRWGPRKPQTNAQVSPSTRATRQSKVSSPSPSTSSVTSEPKRRRTTCRSASTVTRSSSVSLLKTASATSSSSQVPDDDSKDSMASSMDDLVLADIKMEKFTPELLEEEGVDFEMEDKTSTTATEEKETEIQSANGISEPLTVDTETMAVTSENTATTNAALITPEASTSAAASNSSVGGSEKAASLSPEMVSEGVSEISVKQFYKKPKFLENNLGIEEDPKLGEIVQKVSTEKEMQDDVKVPEEETPAKEEVETEKDETPTAVEDEAKLLDYDNSVKEGELHLDESTDEKKSSTNDDSLSTGLLSPLVVDEEEEEEDEAIVVVAVTETASDTELVDSDDVPKLVIEEEDLEEDDLTVEESETISMDNNPSLPEDAPEEREEMDEVEELEKDVETADKELNEKTKNECDNEKAKLEVDSEKKEEIKLITATDEHKKPLIEVEQKEEKKVGVVIEEKEHKIDIDIKLNLKVPVSEVVSVEKIEEKIERLEDDDVLAKIDAELKKIGEKLQEKRVDAKPPIDAGDVSTEVKIKKVENVPPIEAMEVDVDEEKPIKDEQNVVEKVTDILHTEDLIEMKTDKMESDTMETETTNKRIDSTDSSKPPTPASSTNTSPTKPGSSSHGHKDDDTTSMKSGRSTDTNSWVSLDLDDEETLRQKEQHLQNLGLLTHKAAEKRRLEYIQSSAAAVEASRVSQQTNKRNGKTTTTAAHEYTGTLKTVIKLNRSSSNSAPGTSSNGRKGQGQHSKDASGGVRRQSLKMTFQKGRARGQGNADRTSDQHAHSEEAYYTIQNENEGAQKSSTSGTTEHSNVHTHGRKSYNRSNNTSHSTNTTNSAIIDSSHSEGHDVHTIATNKKDEKEVLIPEKASSFKFHPGRLCEDQCFYCSGKFGLYDTPCHVGQIKSGERQQKILANEEKLTVDNCLCDACFRHVDRRANVPSYKKRLSAPGHLELAAAASCSSSSGGGASSSNVAEVHSGAHDQEECLVPDCPNPAAHSLRRKCIRKSVKKFLLNFEMPAGSACVWLCQAHYDTVIQCSGCVLCKRRLGKNHMYHITSDTDRLEKALSEMGIPVQLGIGTAVCKLCRYFANLLMKPPDSTKSQKAEFVKNYRKRLLQFHNIHDGSNDASEADEDDSNGAITIRQTGSNNTPQKKDKGSADMTPSKELPSPTGSGSSVECLGDASSGVAVTVEQQQQMLLDNDVLVDYDVPMISTDSNSSSSPTPPSGADKQMSKLKAILQSASTESNSGSKSSSSSADISNALRANPNISMRELFPGEEDLGLQFKAPFGSSTSQRTPEGWTRVQTFLQYDEPTRRLWEELQKPYGNQSSFLRHLILLEKYYRNGDLVLSPNASSNASVYTQTVRQRLSSYDHGHCGGLQSSKPKAAAATAEANKHDVPTVEINEDDDDDDEDDDATERRRMDADDAAETVSILRKQLRSRSVSVDKLTKHLSSNAVTITTRPKDPAKHTDISPQKSLLKDKETPQTSSSANTAANLSAANAAAAAVLASANGNGAGSSSSNSRSILKTNLLGMNKSVEILPISITGSINKSASYSGSANSSSTSTATESKQQKILDVANKLLGNQLEAAAAAAANKTAAAAGAALLTSPPELVSLQRRSSVNGPPVTVAAIPATITTTTSNSTNPTTAALINAKRPHMMPKATLNRPAPPNVVILPDTLTQSERLQSKSWRPTLMPVEENQHMLNKGGPLYQTADGRRLPALVQVQSGGKPFLISIFDYNRMCILRREKLLRDRMLKDTKNRHEQKQQQQMQKNAAAAAAATAINLQNFNKLPANAAANKTQQQQTAHHQLLQLQLMQLHKHQQHQQHQQQQHQAALKAAAQGRYQPIAPKPIITGSNMSAATSVANSYNAPMMPLLANAITSAASAAASNSNAAAASLNNSSWLWNNFPDANQLLMNNGSPPGKLPQLLHKPTMNSSAATATITSKQQQQQQQQLHHHQQMLLDNTLMSKIPKSLTVIPQHKLMNTSATGHNSSGNSSAGGGSGHRQ